MWITLLYFPIDSRLSYCVKRHFPFLPNQGLASELNRNVSYYVNFFEVENLKSLKGIGFSYDSFHFKAD